MNTTTKAEREEIQAKADFLADGQRAINLEWLERGDITTEIANKLQSEFGINRERALKYAAKALLKR